MRTNPEAALAERLAAEVRAQADAGAERIDWPALLAVAGVSRRQVDRIALAELGETPARMLRRLRGLAAVALLEAGADVLNASLRAGYSGPGRLHDAMVRSRGFTPGEIRRRGEGVSVLWDVVATSIGPVLLGATRRGLCSLRSCVRIPPEEHLAEMRSDWPLAEFRRDPAALEPVACELIEFLEQRRDSFSPEIDLPPGTPFQQRVWEELRRLEPGETVSYSELARRVGKPRAVRAVASVCAANQLTIAIPCHRAMRKDGSLAGFRWGIEWKRRLLEIEREALERRRAG
ncbi:MAG: methylated-DNA--[protein]-cysteine S-methyltransferase [Candidatus Sumerlaeia bacterium]|nr:methylated-DNA--[protein]-cysteine S-methyltransferase [Candidatus Sumerlaeia bacterium]